MFTRLIKRLRILCGHGYVAVFDWVHPSLDFFFRSQQFSLWVLSFFTGLAVGMAAIVFRLLIGVFQWPWLGTFGENVVSASASVAPLFLWLAPVCGGVLVGGLLYFLPSRRVENITDVLEYTHKAQKISLRTGVLSAFISCLSIGAGASVGREGPVVHLGAALASTFFNLKRLDKKARRILFGCGAAAAVSASFNAPIAGVLFAHEVILAHYAPSAFVPIVIASVLGALLSKQILGDEFAFIIPNYQIASYWEFPAFALLGVTCAFVAIAFQFSIISADWLARLIPLRLWLRPVLGGALIGVLFLFFPEVIGIGYETTSNALRNQLGLSTLITLVVVKMLATSVSLASRFGGGVFSPAVYLGAVTGAAFGLISANFFPHLASHEGLYALLGMGAVSAVVLGAPISTTLIVFELTGGYDLSIALLFTISIATGVSNAMHGYSFFQLQLKIRGLSLRDGSHRLLAQGVSVDTLMKPVNAQAQEPAEKLESWPEEHILVPSHSLEEALRAFDKSGHDRLPVRLWENQMYVSAWVWHVDALSHFNKALIERSEEEHR